jgi:hypothetical protein
MMKINRQKLYEITHADDIQFVRKNNTWIFRREFFYTHGCTAEKYAEAITKRLTDAGINHMILDSNEIWKPFRGGASTRASSHWAVEVKFL